MGFPILRLPYVAFRCILRMLEFSELISISFCSQRCHNATKWNLYKLKEWEICVKTYPHPRIVLRKLEEKEADDEDEEEVNEEDEKRVILGVSYGGSLSERQCLGANIESSRMGNTVFRVEITPQGYLTSYWPTNQIGMFECGKYVSDLFQKEIHTIQFENYSMWLMDLPAYIPQKSISKAVFSIDFYRGVEFSSVRRVFEECSSEHLEIRGDVNEAPRLIRYGSFRTVRFKNSTWVTVTHVTNLKCTHISLLDSWWESVDVNEFLRCWIHEGMPRLENIDIDIVSYDIDIEQILDGLDQFVRKKSGTRESETYDLEIVNKSGSISSITVDTVGKMLRMTVNK